MHRDDEGEDEGTGSGSVADGADSSEIPSLEETADVSGLPEIGARVAELDDLGDAADRERVFEALFESTAQPAAAPIGRYVVQGTLGRGAMGTVLKAFDPQLDRRVALKVLHKELDARHTVRLHREAQALAKLSHPNVVQVYEVGEFEGQSFVVMERVKGQTLKQWMHQKVRPNWRECIEVFLQIGAGLIAAHERGLVHRDFKPTNAIIDKKGRPRVLDFGLARQAQDFQDDQTTTARHMRTDEMDPLPFDAPLTGEGTVLGTPAYMSPEQMRGEEADARSDQFSFCVTLFEALYGMRPYDGTSMAALMVSMMRGKVRRAPKGVKVPGRLRTILVRGLSREPAQRWASMEALLAELRRELAPRRRPWLALGGALGLAAVAGIGWFSIINPPGCDPAEQLDGVWDDARRERVESAALRTQLDEYAEEWAVEFGEVCRSTRAFNERALDDMGAQLQCLAERRSAIDDVAARQGGDAMEAMKRLRERPRCQDERAIR